MSSDSHPGGCHLHRYTCESYTFHRLIEVDSFTLLTFLSDFRFYYSKEISALHVEDRSWLFIDLITEINEASNCSSGLLYWGFQDELFDFFENFLKGAQRVHTFCRHSSLDIAFFFVQD